MGLKENVLKLIEVSYLDFITCFLVSLFIFYNFWSLSFFKVLGIILSLIGFLIWIIGRIHLRKVFQIMPRAKELITTGIYSKIRHPIYIGGFLISVGWVFYTLFTWLNIFTIIYLVLYVIIEFSRISVEEKLLEKRFGKKYKEYIKKTWF
jgi:protein-S-isoprenylcysteine O-methyltransferase Ste14